MIEESSGRQPKLDRVDKQKTVDSSLASHSNGRPTLPEEKECDVVPVEATGRYELKDEIARGGMGVIVHSRDKELQRDLAIKFLMRSKADQPGASLRFVEEAQIAGQLQHPGIVPIYDVGELEDGRPFFSMKLVKGQTLAQLLSKRSSTSQDLTRYLGIFEQVCQAIAYAHSRHVIHRDLKPANIMVGAFGEVQVMDWGLAKVVGDDFSIDEILEISPSNPPDIDLESDTPDSSVRTTRDVEREAGVTSPDLQAHTQHGSVVGTLAYMPPEQAQGRHHLIDKAVDVFSLGAILACILTGKPPYVSSSSTSLRQMAEKGDLEDCYKRIEASGCDLKLQAILRAALAPRKANRTLDAATLALEIGGYIASVSDRLNDAKVESAAAKAREEEAVKASVRLQRRSKIATAMAAIAILASILAGVGGFVAQRNQTALLNAENASRLAAAAVEAAATRRRRAIDRDLQSQLKICESFIDQSFNEPATRSDNDSMQRIRKIQADLQKKLETDSVAPSLKARHQQLTDKLATLETAIHLVDELEDQHTALVADELDGSDHHLFFAGQSEKTLVSKKHIHSAASYKLFEKWLQSLPDQNQELSAEKILEMPPWAQPPIIDGLKELEQSYLSPDSGMLANVANWHSLTLTEHATNGSILSQLPDGSILASGPTPNGDQFDLTFSSDATEFSAFKIEALTDPSLPMMGPGRSSEGDFTICWMQFNVAALDATASNSDLNSAKLRYAEPTFCEAFTTFQSVLSIFDSRRWHCVMAPSKDQHAILVLEESVIAANGFSVKLNIQFNRPGRWGDQSLGRFRVSVASMPERKSASNFAVRAGQIADQVIKGRKNVWEQEYWQARGERKGDALASELLRLANMPAFKHQHSVYLIRLAELLKEQSEPWWINQMNQHCKWHVIDADDVKSDIKTKRLKDGSWLVGPPDMTNSEITGGCQHTFRFSTTRPISHLKFESMRDSSLPQQGPGRGVDSGQFAIADLKLIRNGHPTKLDTALSNFPPSVDTDIARAIDASSLTFWSPQHPTDKLVRTAIFQVNEEFVQDGLLKYELTITSGRPSTSAYDSLGRFRISWCGDSTQVASPNPANIAVEILDEQYMRDPSNYSTLVSLARAAALKNPPDYESAANYGWTVYALKPEDTNSIAIAVRTILRRNPAPGSAELARAILLARKARDIDFKSAALEQVFSQQINFANDHYGQRHFQLAERAYRTAYDLITENFPFPGRWGHCLTEIGELQHAREVMLERFKRSPNNTWLRVHLAQNAIAKKEYYLAEEYIDPVVTKHPKNLVALMFKVQLAARRGNHAEVVQLLKTHKEVAPLTARGTGFLYRALFASDRTKEIEEELPATFEKWPNATKLLSDVCLIMTANERTELLKERLKILRAKRPIQLNYIIESIFLSEVQPPEAQRGETHGLGALDTIDSFCKLAGSVLPNSVTLDRLNCIVQLKREKWKSAINDIDDGNNPQSRFSLLAKAWCQFELGNASAAEMLVKQSLTADANHRPQELEWLRNQLEIRAREPNSSILQIFGPAIQMVSSRP